MNIDYIYTSIYLSLANFEADDFVQEKVKSMDLSETTAVCDIKVVDADS